MSQRTTISIKTAVIAIVFGYLVMAITLGILSVVLSQVFGLEPTGYPEAMVPIWAMVTILLTGAPAAIAGGYACSAAYRYVESDSRMRQRRRTVQWFAGLVVLASIGYTISSKDGPQPVWYLGVIIAQGPIGILLGGWMYERLRGSSSAVSCPNCRYDLTGNTTGVCPECGSAYE